MSLYIVEWWVGAGRSGFWHVKARNGEIVLSSEAYTSAWSARRTAKKIAKGLNAELRQR